MAGDEDLQKQLRRLPSVDRVIAALGEVASPAERQAVARRAVDEARVWILKDKGPFHPDAIVSTAQGFLAKEARARLQPVINASGVLLHTNLGRAPLGPEQLEAVQAVASGYSNLEYDLGKAKRGSRYTHAARSITTLTGAEAALVVNNNAAAVLLALASLANRKEVIISRGELVEIGGEFRIPDVMRAAGAKLVEVGTTNRTHLGDYEKAISPKTAAILKVHPSNYRVVGFTATVEPREVARLALARHICFIHDIGSGLVNEDATGDEPVVSTALKDGADLVTFSGDKLLGGPQAGVICGRANLVEKMSRHPLLRAMRPDKMTLAALEATLRMYLEGRRSELPLWRMAETPVEVLEQRAEALAPGLSKALGERFKIEARPLSSVMGGGSLLGAELPSWGLSISHEERNAEHLRHVLHYFTPSVIGRVENDLLLLDLRSVAPEQDEVLLDVVGEALADVQI